MPLSVLRGARLPGEAWTRRDAALAQAAKLLDWSRCPGCGQPRWLAHDPKSKWRPTRVKCQSCQARADLDEKVPLPEDADRSVYHTHTEHVED